MKKETPRPSGNGAGRETIGTNSNPADSVATDRQQGKATVTELWSNSLLLTDTGKNRSCVTNAIIVLTQAPAFAGMLAFDEQTYRIRAVQPPPWDMAKKFAPREWTTFDDVELQNWLHKNNVHIGNIATVVHAVLAAARKHPFHPVRDFLDSILWDERCRLDSWLARYLGAEETKYTKLIGPMILIGAVARIYQPGAQVDTVAMLEGRQGSGKSQAVRELGYPWTTEGLPDLHSREAMMQIQGSWIIELAELSALKKSDLEATKASISRRVDRFRVPYATRAEDHPRQCIFIGTTNSASYLTDLTGNRRFWPIRCGRIDLAALAKDREQIWAEAIERYNAGDRWHTTGADERDLVENEQESRRVEDPWEGELESYLAGLLDQEITEVFLRCVLKDALSIDSRRVNTAHARRMSDILQRLGWQKRPRRTANKRKEQPFEFVEQSKDPDNQDPKQAPGPGKQFIDDLSF